MVVFVVDVVGILVGELESHPPVAADLHGPSAVARTLKFVQPQAGQIHIACRGGCIETAEDQAKPDFMLGLDAPLVPGGEELFETFVPKALDRHSLKCNL